MERGTTQTRESRICNADPARHGFHRSARRNRLTAAALTGKVSINRFAGNAGVYSNSSRACLSAGARLFIILSTLERQPWYRLALDQALNHRIMRMRFPG